MTLGLNALSAQSISAPSVYVEIDSLKPVDEIRIAVVDWLDDLYRLFS